MVTRPWTMVALGGSITTGYAAEIPATGGWAALVAQGLAGLLGQEVVLRNRGVSGTDSAAAALRAALHAEGADLVVVEFAINDQWLDPTVRRQSYEGVLRQLLTLGSRPRVLCLFLAEQAGAHKGLATEQRVLADYYGLPWVEARPGLPDAGWNPGDPIHPNDRGHRGIADAVLAALPAVLDSPVPAPVDPRILKAPLYSSDWQWARASGSSDLVPLVSEGWNPGSDVHPEWAAHGGAPSGWSTRQEGAELVLTTRAKVVGLWYSESDGYRNLEARVDEGEWVTLAGYREFRKGYLGWAYALVARGLTGEHRLTIRPKADEWAHSGRPAHVVALVEAGIPQGLSLGSPEEALAGLVPRAPKDLPLNWSGRFDPAALPGAQFGWQLGRLAGRFTGPILALAFGTVVDRNEFDLWVDGRSWLIDENADSPRGIRLEGLGEGSHLLEVVKRSEGYFGKAVLDRMALAPGERWLDAPARPAVRLELYGDSITAGACNEDLSVDQYDHLARHDPQMSYGAIAARRLGLEVANFAVSGTGLTCSWNPILMAEVFDRVIPEPTAPVSEVMEAPHIVVVNLGQNDHGFPRSQGRELAPDYGSKLETLVRALRRRYPQAWLVGALGGMSAVHESDDLRRQWTAAWGALAQDPRVRWFFFHAATANHPRVDVHAQLAEELTAYLAQEVLPHLAKSPL